MQGPANKNNKPQKTKQTTLFGLAPPEGKNKTEARSKRKDSSDASKENSQTTESQQTTLSVSENMEETQVETPETLEDVPTNDVKILANLSKQLDVRIFHLLMFLCELNLMCRSKQTVIQ